MLNFQTWERVCKVFIFMSYSGDPPSLPPNCHVLDLLVSKICHRKDRRWRPWGSRVTSLSVVIFSGVKIPPKSWTAQAASLWGLCSKTSGIRFRHVCKARNKSKELRLLPFCEENKTVLFTQPEIKTWHLATSKGLFLLFWSNCLLHWERGFFFF